MNREFQIIFCGKQAIDGDTAQVGPQIAEELGIDVYKRQPMKVAKTIGTGV